MAFQWCEIDLRSDPDEGRYEGDPGELVDVADLLAELAHRPRWMADAACRGQGPARWFPGRGEDVRPAKAICAGCAVRSECASFAVGSGDLLVGIWAGLSDRGRRQVRHHAA